MKKLIPLFLLLFCLQTAYGQKIRFTDTSNKWAWESDSWGNGSHPSFGDDYYSGDTVIKGKVYQKQFNRNNYGVGKNGLFRDDTTLNQVLFFGDTTEYVWYNYNLQVGDTFEAANDSLVVYEIDSVNILGNWYRVWFSKGAKANIYIVVEGIGNVKTIYFENGDGLICFKNRGNVISVHDSLYRFNLNPTTCALSVNNITPKSTTVTISPNPANEYSKIIFPYNIQSGSLYISNMLGQVVVQRSIVNSGQVYIGNGITAEGVYFYMVSDNQTGNNFTGRFVYQ